MSQGRHPIASLSCGVWLFSFFSILLGVWNSAYPAGVRISTLTIGPNNIPRIEHEATSNHYYLLLRGTSIIDINQPVNARLFTSTNGVLTDSNAFVSLGSVFYRVREVPVEEPLDSDGDGLNDVFELLRPLYLDPLNPHDGPVAPPTPTITYPTNATMASFVIFSGQAPTNTLIRVEGGAAYVTNRVDSTGFFEVTVPLNPNRLNRLFVSAVNEFGQASPAAPIDILQDSTAPYLFIDLPTNGMVLTAESTLVAGRVGDTLSGFLGLNVTVNGLPANVDVGIGPNGTFQRGAVALAVGTNEITVVATDRLGNSTTKQVTVIRREPEGVRLVAVSGDLQETNIVRRLAAPLVVKLAQPNGAPIANTLVNLQVTRSDGRLLPVNASQLAAEITSRADYTTNGTMFLQLFTDAAGEARAWWTMGNDAGHANNRVVVSSAITEETVFFCASALALPAKQINVGSGNNQRGETFGPAAEPLKVWVSDGNNPVAGVPVIFRVVTGGGTLVPIIAVEGASPAGPGLRAASRAAASFAVAMAPLGGAPPASSGTDEVTVYTSVTGHAEVDFTYGPLAGNQTVEATFPGNTGVPTLFSLRAVARQPGMPTRFTGIIQDNAVQPIGGAWVELEVAGARYQTTSDTTGRFAFSDIASGAGHLKVNGNSATSLGTNSIPTNTFPSLQYTITVVPNAENSLPGPVLLPRLNPNNARWYYGTNDIVLTCEGIAGLKMTIKANSMKHPDGEIVSPVRPAYVSLNQVHHDDIPMPMPDGAAPPFAWTLQPGGATFDPPVFVEYPNMSGLLPGAAAFFLTFNHDTERFEIVASGHVVEDGSKIVCDPGTGLTISGWGGNCPPYTVTGGACYVSRDADCKECNKDGNIVPKANGLACDDHDACTIGDSCQGGTCKGSPPGGSNCSTSDAGGPPSLDIRWTETSDATQNSSTTIDGIRNLNKQTCYNNATKSWEIRVAGNMIVDATMNVANQGWIEPNPVVGGNVNAGNYCSMINNLMNTKSRGIRGYSTMDSVRAHEMWHRTVDLPVLVAQASAKFWVDVRKISVACNSGDPDAGRQAARDAYDKAWAAFQTNYFNSQNTFSANHDAKKCDGAYNAGQAILNPLIEKIRNFATAQGFDPCIEIELPCPGTSPSPAPGLARSNLAAGGAPVLTNMTASFSVARMAPAGVTNLVVLGMYDDGTVASLTGSVPIRYGVNSPAIASIDPDGQITALSSGVTVVMATLTPPGGEMPWIVPARVIVLSANDRDGDGIPDADEIRLGLNPDDPNDAELDPDGDGLSNYLEYLRATDPFNPDTDGDGAPDGVEADNGEDPLQWPPLDPNWQVYIGGQLVPINPDGTFAVRNISAPDNFGAGGPGTPPDNLSDDYVRVIGQRDYHGTILYVFSQPFQIRRGASFTVPELTFTRLAPPAPESLVVIPDSVLLNVLGQTTQVRVWGTLGDGSVADLTPRTTWTSYRSSNPAIATVNPDGVVTARGRGMVFITAVNDGATAVCQIDVSPGDLLTEVRGIIRDTNGVPASGISLNIVGFATPPVESAADGSFVFTNVPSGLGNFQIIGRLITSNAAFFVTSPILTPVPGGLTDAGNLTLRQGITWVGAVSSVWHGPTNWSNGQVPGPTSDVFISAPPNVSVTISQGSNVVNNLVVITPLRITGGSLRVQNGISASSPVQLAGGTISRSVMQSVGGTTAISGTSGTLDRMTLNGDLDVSNGSLNVINGLVLNGVARIGHPTSGTVGSLVFNGSQAISGSGSVVFGSSGCNTLRVPLAATTLTNRLFIRGQSGQIGYSTCVGGAVNGSVVNEATISADVSGGTIIVRGASVLNQGQFLAGPGTLQVVGLRGNVGNALVSTGGHLDLDGIYTNNLVLPVNGGRLTLSGDWFNGGTLQLSNAVFNLDGTFGLGDLGTITRTGGTVQVTGTLNGGGGTLSLSATTGSWAVNGGTLRQLTVSTTEGAALVGGSGTLDAVTINGNLDILNGNLNVVNGLTLNGVARLGHPSSGNVGTLVFNGSQAISGSGSVLFGNSGCNALRVPLAATTLTNRLLIHGQNGQVGYSTCVGGAVNGSVVNEGTIAADVSGGTIIVRGPLVLNQGQLLAGPGTLQIIGMRGDVGNALVSTGGHLDLDGIYTNNLALPVNSGTLTLSGDWFNGGSLQLSNSTFNLDGTFGLADLGSITRTGGTMQVTGTLNGGGGTLELNAATGNWTVNGGTLRQLTVNASEGAILVGLSGTLDAVTLNCNLDLFSALFNGALNVVNGLVLNGVARVGHPSNGAVGSLVFNGSQAISGTGRVIFGNSGCNTLRVPLAGTTVTNRLLIRGQAGQIGYSTCPGGAVNGRLVNEGTISADVNSGLIILRGVSVVNQGQLLAGPGTLQVIGLTGNVGNALVSSGGHLDLDGVYTNNLALPVNGGTLTFSGDWFNGGDLQLSNAVFNLDGTFGLGDVGVVTRTGGTVQVTGTLNGDGGTLELNSTTGNWTVNGGTLRQLVVNATGGAVLLGVNGTLDGVTLNANLDVIAGTLNVVNGLVLNGVARVGHPSSGTVGSLVFNGSQAIGGSGSVVFGSSGCNTLRVPLVGTTLTNRLLIRGQSGQVGYSTCIGGAVNGSLVNEGTMAADVSGGTIIVRGPSVLNQGQLVAGPGTLQLIGLRGDVGNALVSTGGHLDLDGIYTNNLALSVNAGRLTLSGDWFNAGELQLSNAVFNLDGTFKLGDLGTITRSGGTVQVTGTLNGDGETLDLNANTGSWTVNGGTLRQLVVNTTGGAVLVGVSGTLDAVTLNGGLDILNGGLNVVNGLVLNGVARVGHPSNGSIGSLTFNGGQAIGGSGSVLFGNSGCNTLRVPLAATTLTNRLLIHGTSGQIGYSTCIGGAVNGSLVNEGTIAADGSGGLMIVRGPTVLNQGQLVAGPGTLQVVGLRGDVGNASVSAVGHLDLDGIYTNNLALPVNGGTLTLRGDWSNRGELQLSNSVFNLNGTFGLGDLGTITRTGGTVQVTGTLDGGGGTLGLNATTGNWSVNGGTLRQLVVNTTGGAVLVGVSGTLDAVTVNGSMDVLNGGLNVINGLVLNGVGRVGHPSNGSIGSLAFNGSQAIGGSGSVLFGNSGCNALRVPVGGTTLTNRLLIHGINGQIGWSSCVGGAVNGSLVNEGTISADVNNGTLTIRVLSFINNGTTNSLNGGHLVLAP